MILCVTDDVKPLDMPEASICLNLSSPPWTRVVIVEFIMLVTMLPTALLLSPNMLPNGVSAPNMLLKSPLEPERLFRILPVIPLIMLPPRLPPFTADCKVAPTAPFMAECSILWPRNELFDMPSSSDTSIPCIKPAVNPPAKPDFNTSPKLSFPVVINWTPVFIAIEITEPFINPAVNAPAASAKAPVPNASVTAAPALAAKPPREKPGSAGAPATAEGSAAAAVPPP